MRIDVWSDLVCPFCHLGRRHLELALADFEHAAAVEVVWHSYELDRNAPAIGAGSVIEQVAAKYGVSREQMEITHRQMAEAAAAVGLEFAWDKLVASNSYDAHRLIHAARDAGLEDEVTERIMRAWYSEGRAIGDHGVLRALATGAGLSAEVVDDVLGSDDYGIDVRTDEAMAGQIGITGVPTFVLDQKYAVTGAQPPQLLLQAIEHAWADQGNRPELPDGGGCAGDCCGGGGCGSEADEAGSCSTDSGCGEGACGGLCGDADEHDTHDHETEAVGEAVRA